jgi:uncharacterized repeat protein (TIGR03803 family)
MSYQNSAWRFIPLYSFQGVNDGSNPTSRIVIGPDGALYGTTIEGGGQGDCHGENPHCGTVFRLQPPASFCRNVLCPWTETILYAFTGGADGAFPSGDIIFDPAGNIYGTTSGGGYFGGNCSVEGCGVVYKLSPANGGWTETTLYAFMDGTDGANPNGGVVRDAAGNLYGTTANGGIGCPAVGCGTVFEVSPSQGGWTESLLYEFQGFNSPNGAFPYAGLTMDSAGNLYGSTVAYGSAGGGTIFELTPSGGSWNFATIYALTSFSGGGGGPVGALTLDGSANLYGAPQYDGAYNVGSVIKLTPSNGSWVYTDIYDFSPAGTSGWLYDGLVLGAQGAIYGTAYHGGSYNYGIVFELMQ